MSCAFAVLEIGLTIRYIHPAWKSVPHCPVVLRIPGRPPPSAPKRQMHFGQLLHHGKWLHREEPNCGMRMTIDSTEGHFSLVFSTLCRILKVVRICSVGWKLAGGSCDRAPLLT